MKHWFAIFVGILTTLVCHAGDTYYVIQNVETGLFMQYHKDNLNHETVTFADYSNSTPLTSDTKNALWKIASEGTGVSFYSIGGGGYLKSHIGATGMWGKTLPDYDGYYAVCYSSSNPTAFYLFPNPYNEKGYAVSYSSTGSKDNKDCWYAYYKNSTYWLCSTEGTALTTNRVFDKVHFYHLSTFRFLSFKDLFNQATVLGASLSFTVADSVADSKPAYTNYAALVNAIASKLSTRDATPEVFSTDMFSTGNYPHILLRNQRFGTYLAMDPEGNLYATDAINTDCVWVPTTIKATEGKYSFSCFGNGKPLTITYNKKSQSTITLYKSDEADTVEVYDTKTKTAYPSGYFRISGEIDSKKVYLLTNSASKNNLFEDVKYTAKNTSDDEHLVKDADWEAVPYDMDDNIENIAVREANLKDSLFYRIENEGYALAGRSSGWLSYDDHVDMRAVDAVKNYLSDKDADGNKITDPQKIYAFSVQKAKINPGKSKSKASANTLWHFILRAKATTDNNDEPIAIIGTHAHNLYMIKNANALQYLALPDKKDNTYQGTTIDNGTTTYYYMKTTSDPSKAALFWLEDLHKGQYAIVVRDPDNSSTSDTRLGYLRILDDGTSGTGNIGYKRAALILDKTTSTTTPTASSNGAWCLLQATYVHAKTATATTEDDKTLAKKLWGDSKDIWGDNGVTGFRYVTTYYPFNVAPTNSNAKIFKGIEYANDDLKVYFKEVNKTIPGFTGTLVMVPNTDKHNYIELSINSYAPGTGFEDNVLKGIRESEDGPDFETSYQGDNDSHKTDRDKYYVFTTDEWVDANTDKTVSFSLMHPADAWLMANRVYIPNTKNSSAKALTVKFLFDDMTTSISPVHYHSPLDGYWYNLSGQRVLQPTNGIFIHNGKKIVVK